MTPDEALLYVINHLPDCAEGCRCSLPEAKALLRRHLSREVLAEGRGWQETGSVWIVETNPDHLVGGPSRPVFIVAAECAEG